MTKSEIPVTSQNEKTILLHTGNIMRAGGCGGFLNTSMSKNNAELVNSLRYIKPKNDEGQQWQWRESSVVRLWNPESEDALSTQDSGRGELDVTVKLFFLPEAKEDIESRRRYAEEALANVATTLGVDKFDTMILSLPGITFESDEEDYSSKEFLVDMKTKQSWLNTWEIFELMYLKGHILNLGIAEFGIIRLKSLLPHVKVRPVVDQINLRDSCDVPHDLLEFAKQAGIKLMPHMDEDNPLPKETLQKVLDDLGISEKVVEMRWVIKYTAVVKERGVIENKGYIVSAQIQ